MVVVVALVVAIGGLFITPPGRDTAYEAALEVFLAVAAVIIMLLPIGIGIGLWMLSKPEPRQEGESVLLSTAVRSVIALVILALALWFGAVGRSSTVWSLTAREITANVCFVVVWLHMLIVIRQVRAIKERCAGTAPKRLKYLRRHREAAIYVPALLLVLHWLGPMRWGGGGWSRPSESVGVFVMGIGWLLVTGLLIPTLRMVTEELSVDIARRPEGAG